MSNVLNFAYAVQGVVFKASPMAGAYFVNSNLEMALQFSGLLEPLLQNAFNATVVATNYLYQFFGGNREFPPFLDASCIKVRCLRSFSCFDSIRLNAFVYVALSEVWLFESVSKNAFKSTLS